MTDKVQKIREEVEKLRIKNTEAFDCGCDGTKCAGYDMACDDILSFIDSMQEEPVSDELEKAAEEYIKYTPRYDIGYELEEGNDPTEIECFTVDEATAAFIAGAKWQKENLWKPADGDDLPDIGREVIVLIKDSVQRNIHAKEYLIYRIGFGHRPNPDGWDGKNIDTDEVTHYTPKLYDKGGWNAPNIAYWLDIELPKEIEL